MDSTFTSFNIEDRTFVAYAKREIHTRAMKGNFSQRRVAEIDIIVSELCSNLIKHAGSGELLYRQVEEQRVSSVEILALDKGYGMADAAKMVRDGMSTSNTLGHGLGSIQRLSDQFQIYSMVGFGTVVFAGIGKPNRKQEEGIPAPERLQVRGICVPKPRETHCGDGFIVKRNDSTTQIFLGDGLGHGEFAQEAVEAAAAYFLKCDDNDPVDILRGMHECVRRTRGLVATIAVADMRQNEWKVCGVGNISTRVFNGIESRNHMSYNGTIGLNIPRTMTNSVYVLEKNQRLVMVSDGLRARWEIMRYPGILRFDNILLACMLYRDFTRGIDDASVLVASVA
jgi:anti-sigma regulatory factor (Ser/Thr protein kinase)